MVSRAQGLSRRAGDDVIEHPQRADARLPRIAIAIQREVPAGVEPAALLMPDGARVADRHVVFEGFIWLRSSSGCSR